jgi:hypothetical protein
MRMLAIAVTCCAVYATSSFVGVAARLSPASGPLKPGYEPSRTKKRSTR